MQHPVATFTAPSSLHQHLPAIKPNVLGRCCTTEIHWQYDGKVKAMGISGIIGEIAKFLEVEPGFVEQNLREEQVARNETGVLQARSDGGRGVRMDGASGC